MASCVPRLCGHSNSAGQSHAHYGLRRSVQLLGAVAFPVVWQVRVPVYPSVAVTAQLVGPFLTLPFPPSNSGMQTWEYAPQFALRTYAYLYPLVGIGKLYEYLLPLVRPSVTLLVDTTISHDRMALFLLLRATLAAGMGLAEVQFLMAISEPVPFNQSLERQPLVTVLVSYVTAACLLTSAGMAHASGALLPSSTFLFAWLIAATAYVRQQWTRFVLVAVTATLAIGWPFGVIVLLPMGVHILWTCKHPIYLLLGTCVYTLLAQAIVMMIDYQHYGRWTMATYNIFSYNAQGGGDELYGVEPISYYIKNAMLNFNYMAGLALLVLPVCSLRRLVGHALPTPLVTMTASLYGWLAVVGHRPHKEERFLFPCYAIACLSAVLVVEQLWKTVLGRASSSTGWSRPYWILLLIPSCLLGISRTMALSKYYTAPLALYAAIPPNARGLVCTCGEWYRFPSSFLLPPDTRLAFVKSSFTGQLPKQFDVEGSKVGTMFNDANREEMDRYVQVQDCDYVVELEETRGSSSCIVAMNKSHVMWNKMASFNYLDAAQTSSLHRVLYLPYHHERSEGITYLSYSLFKNSGSNLETDGESF